MPNKGIPSRLALIFICLAVIGCNQGLMTSDARTLVATGYVRETLDAITLCMRDQTLFAARSSDGHYVSSNDFGSTWVDIGGPVLGPAGMFQQCEFLHGFKFLATGDGRVFRATPEDWTNWTEVSVPT